MSRALTFLAGAATGAAAAYFLDPQGGAKRRSETKDKTMPAVMTAKDKTVPAVKTAMSSATTQATAQATKVAGKARGAMPSVPGVGETPDDVTLAHTVETEIFRPDDAPKGAVSVNAENGVVFLRGEVDPEWIERLGSGAAKVDGVKAVRNLLHAPGTPAPSSL
jgi:osmotically-inducible protein OsmY